MVVEIDGAMSGLGGSYGWKSGLFWRQGLSISASISYFLTFYSSTALLFTWIAQAHIQPMGRGKSQVRTLWVPYDVSGFHTKTMDYSQLTPDLENGIFNFPFEMVCSLRFVPLA